MIYAPRNLDMIAEALEGILCHFICYDREGDKRKNVLLCLKTGWVFPFYSNMQFWLLYIFYLESQFDVKQLCPSFTLVMYLILFLLK